MAQLHGVSTRQSHTVKRIHERIACDGRTRSARRSGKRVVFARLVAAHDMLHSFIRGEIDGMRGT